MIAIITKQAGVRYNSFPNILKGTLACIRPDPGYGYRIGILVLCGKLLKGGNPELKVVDVLAVKLGKSDKFCNIVHYLRAWPSLKKLMLGLSRSVPFGADIIPHEFETLGEDKTFLEA